MLEKYYKYRLDYREFLILIKFGNFYECFEKDAFILNELFNYKINRIGSSFKAGFPVNSLNSIISVLDTNKINYLVVTENELIKKKYPSNNYLKYKFDMEEVLYNYLRVEKISKYLETNITDDKLGDKLIKIERIVSDK